MSALDLLVIASNLTLACGVATFCIRRDRGMVNPVSTVVESVAQAVESISRAGAWHQPLQSPAQN